MNMKLVNKIAMNIVNDKLDDDLYFAKSKDFCGTVNDPMRAYDMEFYFY